METPDFIDQNYRMDDAHAVAVVPIPPCRGGKMVTTRLATTHSKMRNIIAAAPHSPPQVPTYTPSRSLGAARLLGPASRCGVTVAKHLPNAY